MKVMKSFFAILALAALSKAQTPNNSTVISDLPLEVIAQPGNITVTPGVLLPQSDVLDIPTLILPSNISSTASNETETQTTLYAAIMLDPTTAAGTFLHWFAPNLTPFSSTNLTLIPSTTSSSLVGASWIAPQPQNDGYTHQYILFLYEQPSNWTLPAKYNDTINPPADVYARFPFDLVDFQRDTGLDGMLRGANWWGVRNTTINPTTTIIGNETTMGSATGSAAVSTFTAGAAGSRDVPAGVKMGMCVAALLALGV